MRTWAILCMGCLMIAAGCASGGGGKSNGGSGSNALRIDTASLPDATENVYYTYPLQASGGTGNYTWSISRNPTWLNIHSSTGELYGTPPTGSAGTYTFTVTVDDGQDTVSKDLTLVVKSGGGGGAPQITTASLPDGRVGDNYSATMTATGGTAPYTWSATGLPAGLSIDAGSGVISGVPKSSTAAQSPYSVTITVTDSSNQSSSKQLQLNILPPTNFAKLAVFSGDNYEHVSQMCLDSNGNIFLAGEFKESEVNFGADFGTTAIKSSANNDYDIFLVKINSDWTFGWVHRFGGPYTDSPEALCTDPNGNAIVVGTFLGTVDFKEDWGGGAAKTSSGFCDAYVVKVSSSGDFCWAYRFGGGGADEGWAVCTDSSGNVYVGGHFVTTPGDPTVNFAEDFGGTDEKSSNGSRDIFITKISPSGDYIWTKTFGGSDLEYPKVMRFSNGYIYVAGVFRGTTKLGSVSLTSNGENDIFIMKMNTDGNVVWAHRIGGAGYDGVWDMHVDPNGYVYIAGYFADTVNFKEDWGGTDSRTPSSYDAFVTKLTTDGDYVWTRVFGSSRLDEAMGVWADESTGDVFVAGYFCNDTNFAADFGGDDPRDHPWGDDEALFLVRMTAAGDYKWVQCIGGTGPIKPWAGVRVDKSKNAVYLAGFFNGTVNFKEDWAATEERTAQQGGKMDGFVIRLDLP